MMTIYILSVSGFWLLVPCFLLSKEGLLMENIVLRMRIARLTLGISEHDDSFIRICINYMRDFLSSIVADLSPKQFIRLHRKLFKLFWKTISQYGKWKGRDPIEKEIKELIIKLAKDNPTWGAPRIHGELLKLGYDVSERTVSQYMPKRPYSGNPIKEWQSFYHLQFKGVAGMDFFTVSTLFFRQLYCFFIISHNNRKLIHFNVTFHPTAEWTAKQLRKAFKGKHSIKYMVHDHGVQFSPMVIHTLNKLGIESMVTDYHSPWQNGIAERWVGNCRRDLLDHVIILNEFHLYTLVYEYVEYYNKDRTHYALDKETPEGRPVIQRSSDNDRVIALPRVCGLHHKYVWEKTA